MDAVTSTASTRELRNQLSDLLGRAMYAGERTGIQFRRWPDPGEGGTERRSGWGPAAPADV